MDKLFPVHTVKSKQQFNSWYVFRISSLNFKIFPILGNSILPACGLIRFII